MYSLLLSTLKSLIIHFSTFQMDTILFTVKKIQVNRTW